MSTSLQPLQALRHIELEIALGRLNPLLAGAAMASSSVFVVSNSLRLRTFQPTRRAAATPTATHTTTVPLEVTR